MCGVVPAPEEAKEYLPGLAVASAISSGTVWAGSSSRTISMLGTDHSMAMAAKSRVTSNGRRA